MKSVIHFKLDGGGETGRVPVFVDVYPLKYVVPGIRSAQVRVGNKYVGVSIDESKFYLPGTVYKFSSREECRGFLDLGTELISVETTGEGFEETTILPATEVEKAAIVEYLFARAT
jgi:hypothetical protein